MGFQIYAGILCPVPAILLFYYTYTTGSYRVVGPFDSYTSIVPFVVFNVS